MTKCIKRIKDLVIVVIFYFFIHIVV